MADYAEDAAAADEMLREEGGLVTLSRPSTSPPTYDPATGIATPVSPTTYRGFGVFGQSYQRDISGTIIMSGEQICYLSPLQTNGSAMPEPTTLDKLVVAGVTWAIKDAGKEAPDGSSNVLFMLRLSK